MAATYAFTQDTHHHLTAQGHISRRQDEGHPKRLTVPFQPLRGELQDLE
jgi:hypothetical protein